MASASSSSPFFGGIRDEAASKSSETHSSSSNPLRRCRLPLQLSEKEEKEPTRKNSKYLKHANMQEKN
ncbi:hypothetical protein C4D60_Mb00t19680 [Musa balbisiana]|uniref:Uncharacterized protein n=1 Tax=Musa balbisiana TaxID=52838 RepID=A0A4S8I4L9_MUSBA|nr:hypothetical protein C4D60_Mb00t19680 [Musa balbisiana]